MPLMNQNLNWKQQLVRLYGGYSDLLKHAQQHRDFIVAHTNSLTPEKYQLLLKNAETDVAFARARLDSVIPAIPVQVETKPVQVTPLDVYPQESRRVPEQVPSTLQESQAQHAPEMMSEEQTETSLKTLEPVEAQSSTLPESEHSGSVGWVIAGIAGVVGFSLGAPLFIDWINKDPQRNLARVRDFLNAFKNG